MFKAIRVQTTSAMMTASGKAPPAKGMAAPRLNATAEAGAMGKAVIASKTGGLAELVQHEVTGLLVPPGDVRALATAMNRLLSDPAFASALGAAGRKRAESFALGPFVTRLDAIGASVIEEHRARRPRG